MGNQLACQGCCSTSDPNSLDFNQVSSSLKLSLLGKPKDVFLVFEEQGFIDLRQINRAQSQSTNKKSQRRTVVFQDPPVKTDSISNYKKANAPAVVGPPRNENSNKNKEEDEKEKIEVQPTQQVKKCKLRRFRTDKLLMRNYEIIKLIGKGSFGEVTKAKDLRTGQIRAIKKIKKKILNKDESIIDKEYEILQKLTHPNIVKIHEYFQDDDFFFLVTEFCEGGELFDKIIEYGSFCEQMAVDIMKQILSAVVFCHEQHVVHRDLKPENLLLESNKSIQQGITVKVIDFGTSVEFGPNEKLNARLGTPYYIAPEVLKGEYDEKCDIWSCGVILYILLCGYPPFNGDNDDEIFENIRRGTFCFPSPEWDQISESAKVLIQKMLRYDAKKRITGQEALQEDWFKASPNYRKNYSFLDKNTVQNLQTFTSQIKLKGAIVQYIANQLITKEEEQELRHMFQQIDENGDGVLSRQEINKAIHLFSKQFGEEVSNNVDELMDRIDIDGNGTININEFITAAMNMKDMHNGSRLKQAFDLFDIVISMDLIQNIGWKWRNYQERIIESFRRGIKVH